MRIFKKIILVLFVILVIIFAVQNRDTTTVELFHWNVTLPNSLFIILVYILGMTTGGILFSIIKNLMKDEPKKIPNPDYRERE